MPAFYQRVPPVDSLKHLISHYWIASWDAEVSAPISTYYTVANTLTEITFAFSNAGLNPQLLFTAVQGHTGRADQIPVSGFNHLLGVSLYSHALPNLVGCSPLELNGQFISLKDLLWNEADWLTEKIIAEPFISRQIQILNQFFIGRLNNTLVLDQRMDYAVGIIRSNQGQDRIPELADTCCLSLKQFERRFKAYTGFNPKLFSRIVRFESVVKSGRIWNTYTEAAHELGYHDQAHFIREFKSFSGLSPKDFWKLSNV